MLANSGIKLSDPEADALKAIASNAGAFRDKAGDIARQLAFAGIAVVWLFKLDSPSGLVFPVGLLRSTTFLVLALVMDLAEYVLGTLIWQTNPRVILRARTDRTVWLRLLFAIREISNGHQDLVARPIRWFFWLKVAFLVVAYALLLVFLGAKSGVW